MNLGELESLDKDSRKRKFQASDLPVMRGLEKFPRLQDHVSLVKHGSRIIKRKQDRPAFFRECLPVQGLSGLAPCDHLRVIERSPMPNE